MPIVFAILLFFTATSGMAQEQPHGNGQRLGDVYFATSCNESAQGDFNFAVALLHSFQFSRAIEGFNAVLEQDATCTIAYWGLALSAWSNPFAPGQKDTSQLQLGRNSGHSGLGMVCASGGQEAGSSAADGVGSEYGRWDRKERGDTGSTVPSAGTARRDALEGE